MRQAWSKKKVVAAILAHLAESATVSNLWQRDPNLYGTAKRFFGSWRNACKAAGVVPARKRWTKELLIEYIQLRYNSPNPLDRRHLKRTSGSHTAAKRFFGSWSAAVKAAGFKPKVCRKWSHELIVKTILQYHAQGIPLQRIVRQDPALTHAAVRYFGSWRQAVQAAGFDVLVSTHWSKAKVLERIQKCKRSSHNAGLPVLGQQLSWAARQYFGSASKALAAAGIVAPKQWTAKQVIAAIQEWNRKGLSIHRIRKDNSSLYCAGMRHFGSWQDTLQAAGFPVKSYRHWSEEVILAAIQAQSQQGLSPQEIWQADPLLKAAAQRYFGHLHRALAAAGLTPRDLRDAGLTPTCRKWDQEKIIAEIRAVHRQGLPLSRFWKEQKQLFHAACRHFGSWQKALVAMGFKPKIAKRWSQERVVEGLRAWHRMSQSNIKHVDPNLARAATRFFGSLENAWESIGFGPLPHRWSKARVIQAIQDGYVQGQPLHLRGFRSIPLADAAKRYFGSWPAAVAAAGLSAEAAQPMTRRWNPQKVLEAIRNRKRQGLSLTSVWREDSGLYSQAKVHFRGWRNAVSAAGIKIFPEK